MASKRSVAAARRRLEAEMRQLGKKLDALAGRARKAEASVRAKSAVQLRKLKAKQAQAQAALARLGRQSAAASGPLKIGVRRAWRDIEVAVRRATRRFRKAA